MGACDETLAKRFWKSVEKEEFHWLWTGSCQESGHGRIQQGARGGRPLMAHRVSWELCNGPIPDGAFVLHKRECSTPNCVRPEHLYLGDKRDNTLDSIALGTFKSPFFRFQGSAHPGSKLNEEKVRHILTCDTPAMELARVYGVSNDLINLIRRRKVWRHVAV